MKNPLYCPVTRAVMAGVSVAGGTLVATVLGGSGGTAVLAQAIAGLSSPFLTDALGGWLTSQTRSPRQIHPNHDLQSLVGDAVQLVLVTAAEQQSDLSIAKSLRRMSESSQAAFDRVKRLRNYSRLSERELPDLFAAAAGNEPGPQKVLTRGDWKPFVNVLARSSGVDDRAAATIAASALHGGLHGAIRELLKRDFDSGGRRFAALTLDLNAKTLRYLAEFSESHRELVGEIRTLRDGIEAGVAVRMRQWESPEELRPWIDEFRQAGMTLDGTLAELRGVHRGLAGVADRIQKISQRLLLRLHLTNRNERETETRAGRRFWILLSVILFVLSVTIVASMAGLLIHSRTEARLAEIGQQQQAAYSDLSRRLELQASGNAEDAPVATYALTRVLNLGSRAQLGAASRLGASTAVAPPASQPSLPPPDIRQKAELLAKSDSPQEKVMGLIVLERHREAAALIAAQRAQVGTSSEQSEFWLLMAARNAAAEEEIVKAIALYNEAIAGNPKLSVARSELIDVYMRPYIGMRGRTTTPQPGEYESRVGTPATYPDQAITQIRILLEEIDRSEATPDSAYLHYRYGLCLHFKKRGTPKPAPEDAVREFKIAARQFYELGSPFMAVVALHQAGLSNLYSANFLPVKDGVPLEGADAESYATWVTDAVECLQSAIGIVIPDESRHVSELTYVVRSRLAQAYILDPTGDRASHLRAALSILKQLEELNERYRFGDSRIPILEMFAYQSLAEIENRKENLRNAVLSSKKQNQFRFSPHGKVVNSDGYQTEPTQRIIQFTFDLGEPAIPFTCFRDWLAAGGTYEEYLLMVPEKTAP